MPPDAILFLISLALVILAGCAMALLRFLEWRDMSSGSVRSTRLDPSVDRRFSAVLPEETNDETDETWRSDEEIEQEKITFAETEIARALARLILAEKIGLTEAVKIGMGKKSGEAYSRASARIKAAIEEQKQTETPIARRPTDARFADRQS